MKQTIIALWGMARPLLLLITTTIYLIGSLIANAFGVPLQPDAFLWGLVPLLLSVLSAHYANEYADYETDALTRGTPFSGGSGVLPRGTASRQLALAAAWITLALSLLAMFAALWTGRIRPDVALVWATGTAISWMYSLPPFRLAWRGWGEVINAVLVGILLPLYGYGVQTGQLDWAVIIGCAPFSLLIFVLVMATNWADREADAAVGKYTLTARLPAHRLRLLYGAAAFAAFIVQPFLAGTILPPIVVLSSLPAVPLVAWAGIRYTRIHSPLPTVIAMLVLLPLQIAAWILAA